MTLISFACAAGFLDRSDLSVLEMEFGGAAPPEAMTLRNWILACGDLAQACYDGMDSEPSSPGFGMSIYANELGDVTVISRFNHAFRVTTACTYSKLADVLLLWSS